MIGDLRPRELAVIASAVVAGLAGAGVSLASRGGDAQFIQEQRHPPPLRNEDVARVVKSAPDPASGSGEGSAATCTRGGSGPLGNPWSCVVRYPSGKRVRIRVKVLSDGTYQGRYAGGGAVSGCCIDLPGTR